MFDTVDTTLGYERELIFCPFLRDFSKGKGINLQCIYTAFLLCEAPIYVKKFPRIKLHASLSLVGWLTI